MLYSVARITDQLEHFWEETVMKRVVGTLLVITYLSMIALIELNRQGLLGSFFVERLPTTHFYAVEVAFTLLLVTEVISLVFGLTRSFSRSIGIQIEILSLILLRDTFKALNDFAEPLEWESIVGSVTPMVADSIGALVIFVILGVYYRSRQSRPITDDDIEQDTFIAYKKLIALGLIFTLALIAIVDAYRLVRGLQVYPFFETFYTVLIFTDVLVVLISLRYSTSYAVTFRNFGFAVVTVFIRLALVAPSPLNALIGVGTALFALGMTYAYNVYSEEIVRQTETESAADTASDTADDTSG